SIRSPQPTSSIDPTETKALKPTLARKLQSSTAAPRAPLWLRKAILPGRAMALATVALRPVIGLITPRLFGPRTRIRPRHASSMIRRSSAAPSTPLSLNPAEVTMAAWTPASTHSPIRSGTIVAGVATMARSIGSGTSPMRGWALIPRTLGRFGLTGKTVPPNGLLIRFHTRVRPMLPALSDAPMTAMLWGVKKACRPPPLAPSKSVATFFSEDSPLAVLMGPFPDSHSRSDCASWHYTSESGQDHRLCVSGQRGASPDLEDLGKEKPLAAQFFPGHEAILRKPSHERSAAREFRSPAFSQWGCPSGPNSGMVPILGFSGNST